MKVWMNQTRSPSREVVGHPTPPSPRPRPDTTTHPSGTRDHGPETLVIWTGHMRIWGSAHLLIGGWTRGSLVAQASCLLLLASTLCLASSLTHLHSWDFPTDQSPLNGTEGDPHPPALLPSPCYHATGLMDFRKVPQTLIIIIVSSSSPRAPSGSHGTGPDPTRRQMGTGGLDWGKRKQSCGVCVCTKGAIWTLPLIQCFESVNKRKSLFILWSLWLVNLWTLSYWNRDKAERWTIAAMGSHFLVWATKKRIPFLFSDFFHKYLSSIVLL